MATPWYNPTAWFGTPKQDQPTVPGPSRGLVARLRDALMPWVGPRDGGRTRAGDSLRTEKAASGPRGITYPWFLPYADADYTSETPQMRLAYRQMLASPDVKPALLGKILGVAALDLKILPADKRNPRDKEVAEFVTWVLTKRLRDGVPGLVWSVLSGGLVDGYSVCEKVFGPQQQGKYAGKWPLRELKAKDTGNDVILQTDEYRNVSGVFGLRYNAGEEFSPADFLIFRYLPLFNSPTGISDLRAAYASYWMLDTAKKLRIMGVEKRALPLLVGHWQTATDQPALERALALAKSQNWISVPDTAKVEAVNIAGSSDEIFSSIVKDLKHDILLSIQGAILQSVEGETTAGRGNSQVHQETRDLLIWHLSAAVEALLNDEEAGLIKDVVDLNYVVSEYPKASLSAVDLDEQLRRLQIYTGVAALVPVSAEEVYEEFDVSPPQNPGDAVKAGGGGGGDSPFGQGAGGGLPPMKVPEVPKEFTDGAEAFLDQNVFAASPRRFAEDAEGHEHGADGRFVSKGGESGKGSAGGDKKGGDRKRPRPPADDPVHSYLDAFVDPGEGGTPATAKEAREANREIKAEGSKFRVVPDGKGGWTAEHVTYLRDNYGDHWTVGTNPLTGLPDVAEPDYLESLKELSGDKNTRSYLHAFNDPAAASPATKEEADQVNRELEEDGSPYRLHFDGDYGLWVARKAAAPHAERRPRGVAGAEPFRRDFSEGWQRYLAPRRRRPRHRR